MATHKMEYYSSSFESRIPAQSPINSRTYAKCLASHTHPSKARTLAIKCTKSSGSNTVGWTMGSAWQSCAKEATCSKTDLTTFMDVRKLQHYSASYEKRLQAENPINTPMYLKCKDGFSNQAQVTSASTHSSSYAPPIYIRCTATDSAAKWTLDTRSSSVTCGIATCSKKDLDALMIANSVELISTSTLATDTAAVATKLNAQCKTGQKMNPLVRNAASTFELECQSGKGWSSPR